MSHMYQNDWHPWCGAWGALERDARGKGLVHGQAAVGLLSSPADASMLLSAMVEAGVLQPLRKDLAGASHSVKAFRGLQGLRESAPDAYPDVDKWLNGVPCEAADAHLWTFSFGYC